MVRVGARVLAGAMLATAMIGCVGEPPRVLTISGSALGRESEVLRRQLDRFREAHPGLVVELRATPDAADLRHQLYVQWLNARMSEPDVLQLDVVWTAEFAAAGWIASMDRFGPPTEELFPATVAAHRWNGALYALPWFVDVGMLYWRTDLVAAAPRDFHELTEVAGGALAAARATSGSPGPGANPDLAFGFVWQGARYEGLVVNFLEHLGAFGGVIMGEDGRVRVDEEPAVAALTFMRDAIHADGVVPAAVLSWQEEQGRISFQNGQAVFMRNWPYAYSLLGDAASSAVAGKFAVAPLPAATGGASTAALGGSALALNAHSDQPADAYRLIEFLLQPAQMMERAKVVAQFPPRGALYDDPALPEALGLTADEARRIIAAAAPRPVTPVYSQLSAILQVALHRALTRQEEPRAALQQAGAEMRALLARVKLSPS